MITRIVQWLIDTGITTTLIGVMVWIFKRSIEKRDKERQEVLDEREAQRFKFEEMSFRKADASLELAIATAKAIQRMPEAKCNGDMHAALEKAESVNAECNDFLRHVMIVNNM